MIESYIEACPSNTLSSPLLACLGFSGLLPSIHLPLAILDSAQSSDLNQDLRCSNKPLLRRQTYLTGRLNHRGQTAERARVAHWRHLNNKRPNKVIEDDE